MTAREFREMALAHSGAIESAHMGHADFRFHQKIFATLGYPDKQHGMVKLPPHEQQQVLHSAPAVFHPAPGAWGRRGCTLVRLPAATPEQICEALDAAWHLAQAQHLAKRRPASPPGKPRR
jgi:hypothetical protein